MSLLLSAAATLNYYNNVERRVENCEPQEKILVGDA
jgi:hypothetical protein